MKKSISIYYITLFVIMICLPVLFFSIFGSHFDTFNYENRELAPKPVLTAGTINDFPGAFESWFNDHLPFRNQLLELNGHIDYDLLHSSAADEVIIGKEGWLFYRGYQVGSEDSTGDYMGTNLFTDEELETIKNNLEKANEELMERGCRFIVYIAPNKERIYSEYMPDAFGAPAENCRKNQLMAYLRENTWMPIIDAEEDIRAFREEHPETQIYFKYDTHWNELGAYVGALSLNRVMGHDMLPADEIHIEDPGEGNFDLARLLHLGNYLNHDHTYIPTGYTYNPIYTESNDLHTEYRFTNPEGTGDDRKVLMIGDSFSSFLSPFVAFHYNNMYDCFYYDYSREILEREQPDIVVYECVERYLGNMLTFSLDGNIGVTDAQPAGAQ